MTKYSQKTIRPLSKFALLGKTGNLYADLLANSEDISEDMAEKLTDKDAKRAVLTSKWNFERGQFTNAIGLATFGIQAYAG